jgi:hypothetical protein
LPKSDSDTDGGSFSFFQSIPLSDSYSRNAEHPHTIRNSRNRSAGRLDRLTLCRPFPACFRPGFAAAAAPRRRDVDGDVEQARRRSGMRGRKNDVDSCPFGTFSFGSYTSSSYRPSRKASSGHPVFENVISTRGTHLYPNKSHDRNPHSANPNVRVADHRAADRPQPHVTQSPPHQDEPSAAQI